MKFHTAGLKKIYLNVAIDWFLFDSNFCAQKMIFEFK